jgi:hypothetical protein
MTKKSRPRSPDEHVDRLLEQLNLTDQQREFISSWRQGGLIDEGTNPEEAQQVALDLMRLAYRVPDDDDKFDSWALEHFAEAKLDWSLAFNETVLHWLAKDPPVAVRKIEVKDAELGRKNSGNAQKDREKAQDFWSGLIQDCLEGDLLTSSEDVIKYLSEIKEVSWNGKFLSHISNAAEPISRAQVRSKMNAAKKRIARES